MFTIGRAQGRSVFVIVAITACLWMSSCTTPRADVAALSSLSPRPLVWSSDARRVALLEPDVTITSGFQDAENTGATRIARDNIRDAFSLALQARGVDPVSFDSATDHGPVSDYDRLVGAYRQNAKLIWKESSGVPVAAIVALVEVRSGDVVWASGVSRAPNWRDAEALNEVARRLLESAPVAVSANVASTPASASQPPSSVGEAARSTSAAPVTPPELVRQAPADEPALAEEATAPVSDASEQDVWTLAPSAAELSERLGADYVLIVDWPNAHSVSAGEVAGTAAGVAAIITLCLLSGGVACPQ